MYVLELSVKFIRMFFMKAAQNHLNFCMPVDLWIYMFICNLPQSEDTL